jgi:excisionase family DNA binding protein
MSARSERAIGPETYLLDSGEVADVVDLAQILRDRGVHVPPSRPALTDADGKRIELPEVVFEALRYVVEAMSRGQGVTIAPRNAMLTTQEAADFLGISRPTLVRLLEQGEIAYDKRGRHRRVRLADLLDYQERARTERRQVLDSMVTSGEAAGLYAATDGLPPRLR